MMSGPAATPWRPAYEAYGALSWMLACAFLIHAIGRGSLPPEPLIGALVCSCVFGFVRGLQALQVWRLRWSLEGRSLQWITNEELLGKMEAKPGHVWFGWGFEWSREHAQRLYDLERQDWRRLRVPWVTIWKRLTQHAGPQKGSSLLHGVEPIERDIYVPLSALKGHLFVPGTTGALKTSLLALLATQAIHRRPRETVVIIEPKGGSQLLDQVRAACRAAGREQDFAYFNPAFPRQSVRIDPLANWTRSTEVASRIGAMIPSERGNDPWSAFGWRVLYLTTEGCLATYGERPTLTTLRRYVEGGVDELLRRTLTQHFERQGRDWRTDVQPHTRSLGRSMRLNAGTSLETAALVALYRTEPHRPHALGVVDGLIGLWEHNREHFQKMLASLLPILTMLTAGDLAGLLSPDRNDPSDHRPILNGRSIADSGAVVYLGLAALSDPVIASAMASIIVADLASYAGNRYDRGVTEPVVNVLGDESDEFVNVPFISMLNKSRGAGYQITFMSQTFSDFVARLGSEALARKVLGNANSIVAGRTKDQVTAEYVMEDFGRTIVRTQQPQHGTNVVADGSLLNYSSSHGERFTETYTDIVPREALGRLPDLEYFASFSGSRIVKGRIPLIRTGRQETLERRASLLRWLAGPLKTRSSVLASGGPRESASAKRIA